jgi:hypothetical protein
MQAEGDLPSPSFEFGAQIWSCIELAWTRLVRLPIPGECLACSQFAVRATRVQRVEHLPSQGMTTGMIFAQKGGDLKAPLGDGTRREISEWRANPAVSIQVSSNAEPSL